MSRISEAHLNILELLPGDTLRLDGDYVLVHRSRWSIVCNGINAYRDARSEIARLTEENARLTNVLSSKERSLKAWRSRCQTAEARLAAATTMTEQLVDVLKRARVYLMQHTTGTETLTDAALGALRAFVADKQAGAGEGENQGGGDATSTPKARKGGGE